MERTLDVAGVDALLSRIESRERLSFEDWKAVEDSASTERSGGSPTRFAGRSTPIT